MSTNASPPPPARTAQLGLAHTALLGVFCCVLDRLLPPSELLDFALPVYGPLRWWVLLYPLLLLFHAPAPPPPALEKPGSPDAPDWRDHWAVRCLRWSPEPRWRAVAVPIALLLVDSGRAEPLAMLARSCLLAILCTAGGAFLVAIVRMHPDRPRAWVAGLLAPLLLSLCVAALRFEDSPQSRDGELAMLTNLLHPSNFPAIATLVLGAALYVASALDVQQRRGDLRAGVADAILDSIALMIGTAAPPEDPSLRGPRRARGHLFSTYSPAMLLAIANAAMSLYGDRPGMPTIPNHVFASAALSAMVLQFILLLVRQTRHALQAQTGGLLHELTLTSMSDTRLLQWLLWKGNADYARGCFMSTATVFLGIWHWRVSNNSSSLEMLAPMGDVLGLLFLFLLVGPLFVCFGVESILRGRSMLAAEVVSLRRLLGWECLAVALSIAYCVVDLLSHERSGRLINLELVAQAHLVLLVPFLLAPLSLQTHFRALVLENDREAVRAL